MAFRLDLSPLERSSQFAAQGLGNIGNTIADAMESRKQDQAQGDIEAFMTQALTGDPVALRELMVKSPEHAQYVAQTLQQQQTTQDEGDERFQGEIAMNTADIVEKMQFSSPEDRDLMFTAAVGDPRYDIDEEDRPFFNDENARKAIIGRVKGQDYADNLFGGKDAINQSLPAEAVAFNDLIKDFTNKEKSEARKVKAGLKGRAMSNALLSAIESGDIGEMKKEAAAMKQAEKFGAMTGASRAKAIDAGIEKIAKIDVGLSNIDAAIEAVNNGAGTGAIEKKFPSLKAASIALDNIQGRMALDVIGAVTFGALSQGELDLAKSIALPTGLEGPELVTHLQDRATAQKKLRDYYNEQIQFLDQGGTVAGFIRQKERGQTNNTDNTIDDDQGGLSDQELLNKYGG